MDLQAASPQISPTVTVDEKTGEKIETWPVVTREHLVQQQEAGATALAAASRDGDTVQDFKDLELAFVLEALKWLIDLSGFSQEAIDDLAWFRGKA